MAGRSSLDKIWRRCFEERINILLKCVISCLKLTNAHTVSGRLTLKNDSGRLKKAKLRTFARKQILRKPIKKLVKK